MAATANGAAYEMTARTKLHRIPDRGTYDKATVHSILEEARTCTVAWSQDGKQFALPQIFARVGDNIYLHGSVSSTTLKSMKKGCDVCFTDMLNGCLLECSMNYRSVMVMGAATLVTDPEEKLMALDAIVEHVMPGRTADLKKHDRDPTKGELMSTAVLKLPMVEVSAKVRTGDPKDDKKDVEGMSIWAGVVPLSQQAALKPVPAGDLQDGVPVPDYILKHTS